MLLFLLMIFPADPVTQKDHDYDQEQEQERPVNRRLTGLLFGLLFGPPFWAAGRKEPPGQPESGS